MNKTALFVLAAIIILGGLWFVAARNNDGTLTGLNGTSTPLGSTPGTNNTGAATPGASSVVLAETSAGSRVVVQSAQLAQPGYIVIYRSTTDGDTKIIGRSSLLEMGGYTNLAITLDSAIATGQSVTAVLHTDDGDGKLEVPGADQFMASGSVRVVSDVDVVGAPMSDEPPLLESQVEAYLDEALEATTTNSN